MSEQLKLIFEFLKIANDKIKTFSHSRNYFEYSNISVNEFFNIAKTMPISEIVHAIECVKNNTWDESNLIMSTEKSKR